MQWELHRYGFKPTKERSVLAADNPQSRQGEKYFKNNDLYKTAKKMVDDPAAHNSGDGCDDQYTQLARNIHKNTPLYLCTLPALFTKISEDSYHFNRLK